MSDEEGPGERLDRLDAELEAIMGRPLFYGFDGKPISRHDFAQLQMERRDFPNGRWRVGRDIIEHPDKDMVCEVSTVWLGHDMSFIGPPLMYETMVFGGLYGDDVIDRYPNRDAALAGHGRAVAALRAGKSPFEAVEDDDDVVSRLRPGDAD